MRVRLAKPQCATYWLGHLAPLQATKAVDDAARAHDQSAARRMLRWPARATQECPVAEIGRAVGISRQSAHERWAAGTLALLLHRLGRETVSAAYRSR